MACSDFTIAARPANFWPDNYEDRDDGVVLACRGNRPLHLAADWFTSHLEPRGDTA